MKMLSRYQVAWLSLWLLVLPLQGSLGRTPWSLPTIPHHHVPHHGRLVIMQPSSSNHKNKRFSLAKSPAMIAGLSGGSAEEVGSESENHGDDVSSDTATSYTTSTTPSTTASAPASNISDEISRGGGATTAVKKSKDMNVADDQTAETSEVPTVVSISHEVSSESEEASGHNLTDTSTSTTEVEEHRRSGHFPWKKPKPEKFHKRLAKKLKNRNARNLRRKVMHASFGIVFAGLNHLIPKDKFVPGMAILSSATLLMELLRYRKGFGWMNHALHFVLGNALRKHEMDGKFTGSFYFFTGVTVTAALYPTTCATLGILQLALADPSASYFGRATRHIYWSRIENGLGGFGRNKGWLGFLGGGLFCFPFNYRILSLAKFGAEGLPGGRTSLVVASLALGFAGAFADLAVPTPAWTLPKKICGVRVPPFHLDDNFVVPIVSGFACTQVFKAMGWEQNLALGRFIFV